MVSTLTTPHPTCRKILFLKENKTSTNNFNIFYYFYYKSFLLIFFFSFLIYIYLSFVLLYIFIEKFQRKLKVKKPLPELPILVSFFLFKYIKSNHHFVFFFFFFFPNEKSPAPVQQQIN